MKSKERYVWETKFPLKTLKCVYMCGHACRKTEIGGGERCVMCACGSSFFNTLNVLLSGTFSGTWNGPVEYSKHGNEWDTSMEQGDEWGNDVGMSQSSGGYSLQQGHSGTGTVFVAQPAVQSSSMMQSNVNRQSDGRYGMAAASVRRY